MKRHLTKWLAAVLTVCMIAAAPAAAFAAEAEPAGTAATAEQTADQTAEQPAQKQEEPAPAAVTPEPAQTQPEAEPAAPETTAAEPATEVTTAAEPATEATTAAEPASDVTTAAEPASEETTAAAAETDPLAAETLAAEETAVMLMAADAKAPAGEWVSKVVKQNKKKVTKWQWKKADGTLAKNEFIEADGNTYYIGSDKYMKTGWFTVSGKKYYADGKGVVLQGWQKVSGKWYYLDPEAGGAAAKGWKEIAGEDGKYWYYFDGSSGAMKTGWITVSKKKYYMNASGQMQTGWLTITKTTTRKVKKKKVTTTTYSYYYLDPGTGERKTGWQTIDGKRYYFASDGKVRNTAGWFKLNKVWYYLEKDETGHPSLVTGWKKVGSKWYFLDPDKAGAMKTGWFTQDGEQYYLNSSGAAVNGVSTISKKKYLFAAGGSGIPALVTGSGRKTVNGKTYYFGADNVLKTGWIKEDGKQYYYGDSMATGWKKISKVWYYFDGNGVMQTGWKKLDGKWYYLKSSGAMVTGWQTIDGDRYHFNSSGVMSASTTVGEWIIGADGRVTGKVPDKMDSKAQGYSSGTKYLILVNRSTHKVGIYQGSKGNWKLVKKWSCGDGAKKTPTPEGTYTVGIKLKYFDTEANNRCWYATQFWGDYLFHSILYVKGSSPSKVRGSVSGQLGRAVSHGCVRLELNNAKWIYNNIPRGTKVVVYH